ncbi:T7SS effector LXG polymorphic toxin [Listeria grayi]|uniref:T7SS effector LXG polymorphic toxin n=1 Tax=Listeria grayi TaxID=1641 RepID=UPI001624C747|nr:T7SS effector LXG polymorphic toxin [Listeria grayi]MBC1921779.1 hypothetical protein [Listeria grayi]
MSVDMFLDDADSQVTAIGNMCRAHVQGLNSLKTAISQFIFEPVLTGKTYDSAKIYFQMTYIPVITGLILAAETLETAAKKLPDRYRSDVDENSLQEEVLRRHIEQLNKLMAFADHLAAGASKNSFLKTGFTKLGEHYQDQQKDEQAKLEKLMAFDPISATLFGEVETLLDAVEQGLKEMRSGKGFSGLTGTFSTMGLNMDWVKPIDQCWKQRQTHMVLNINQIGKEEIIQDYVETYGMKRSDAEILYKLQESILKTAEEKSWDNNQVIYEFNRIIASCASDSYVATRWKAICGTLEEDDLVKLCEDYGLSNSEINKMKIAIDTQHKGTTSSKDLAHEAIQIAAFTEKSWTWYPSISNGVHNVSHLANDIYEHEEISFKGDVDSGRYDDVDFSSDLDAINTYQRMNDSDKQNIFKAQVQYNDAINKNNFNRVEEFYKSYGDGDIKIGEETIDKIMNANTIGSNHINGGYTDTEKQQHLDDFYDYLKRGEQTNVK